MGLDGTGALNVTGDSVTNRDAFVGYNPGSDGTATVSSGTWANRGNLSVGQGNSTGTLTITGGLVSVAGTLSQGASGTINLNSGGTLQIGTGTTSGVLLGGTGSLLNNGTLIFNRFNASTYSGVLSGSGAVTKLGGGTLTLAGANTYSGLTTIAGGTLQIGNGGTTGSIAGNMVNNATLAFNRSNALSFSGTISGSGGLTKSGAGALTLAGANTYSGLTTISGGALALSGSGSIGTGGLYLGTNGVFDLAALASGTYALPATGNLLGTGTLSGSGKALAVLGNLLPGSTNTGTFSLGTGLALDLSGAMVSAFDITSPAFSAGTFDLVTGDGSVVYGGILDLAFSGGAYAEGTDVLQIFATTGGRTGSFSAINVSGLGPGQTATFNPATGSISIVPEPTAVALLVRRTAARLGVMRACGQVAAGSGLPMPRRSRPCGDMNTTPCGHTARWVI